MAHEASAPARESEVGSQMGLLSKAVGELESAASYVEGRLERVTRGPETMEKNAVTPKEVLVTHASEIRELRLRVEAVTNSLVSLRDRIEV